jgi:hypothetical protein
MYGREAMEKAAETKNDDYDPEEDFWWDFFRYKLEMQDILHIAWR